MLQTSLSQLFVPTDAIKVDQLADPPSSDNYGKDIHLALSFVFSSYHKVGEVGCAPAPNLSG